MARSTSKFLALLISIGAFVFMAVLSGCTHSKNEIAVGEYGSLTGSTATFGKSTNAGIKMAFDEVNEKGGVKGKKIRLITLDDQGKQDEAAAAVTRLITQNDVVAVIGEVASSLTEAAAPVAQQHHIPLITPSSTNPKITKIGDYVFRVCFIDPFQGYVMAKFAFENLKLKKVAIFRDKANLYSIGLADAFVESFTKMGGTIAADLSYQEKDIDFKAQLTQMKGKAPEAIFIPGYYTEVGLIARQAQQLGLKVPLLGGDGWDSARLNEIGKEAINGAYYSNHYSTESTDPTVQDFIKKFQTRYHELPDGLAALGYDAAKILVAAMERTSDVTPKNIRDR
jgi:branched-chain amino acid transport system substrate-binding protein